MQSDLSPKRGEVHRASGETVTVDLWKEGDVISFEARVKERNVTVIKNGKTVLG